MTAAAKKKTRYEVLVPGGKWETCQIAAPVSRGWLEYKLRDGTVGLKPPEKWRIRQLRSGQ